MIVIIGVILLLVAGGVAFSAVVSNMGSDHVMGVDFQILGLQLSGLSSGQVFLFGLVVGFVGMLGLAMIYSTFGRRMARRRARREISATQERPPDAATQ